LTWGIAPPARALVNQGFEVAQNTGGLFLRANQATLKAFRKHPGRLAQLGPTLTQAVLVTRGLGGEPGPSVAKKAWPKVLSENRHRG